MPADLRKLEKELKALANKRRLEIARHLKHAGEASVSDIAGVIRLSFKATSKHLMLLRAADIVEREQRSLQMFYRLNARPGEYVRGILKLL